MSKKSVTIATKNGKFGKPVRKTRPPYRAPKRPPRIVRRE